MGLWVRKESLEPSVAPDHEDPEDLLDLVEYPESLELAEDKASVVLQDHQEKEESPDQWENKVLLAAKEIGDSLDHPESKDSLDHLEHWDVQVHKV